MSDFHQYYNTRKKKQSLARIHTLDEYLEIDTYLLTNESAKSQSYPKADSTSQINNSAIDKQVKSTSTESKNKPLVNTSASDKQLKSTHTVSKNKLVMESSDPLSMNLKGCRKVDCVGEVVIKKKEEKKESSAKAAKDDVTVGKEENDQKSSNELEAGLILRSSDTSHSSITEPIEILGKLPPSPPRKPQQMISIKSPAVLNEVQQMETENSPQKIMELSHQSSTPCMASPLPISNSCEDICSFTDPRSKISTDILSRTFMKTGIPFDPKKPFVIKVRPIGSEASVKRLCSPATSNSLRKVVLTKPSSFIGVQSVSERDFLKLVKVRPPNLHGKSTPRQENVDIPHTVLEKKDQVFPVALKSSESQDFQLVRTENNIDDGDEILGF